VLQKVGRAVLFSNAGHAKSPKSSALTTVDLEKSQLVSKLFNRLPWARTGASSRIREWLLAVY
jgi:hypothetical protein